MVASTRLSHTQLNANRALANTSKLKLSSQNIQVYACVPPPIGS